MVLSKMCKKIQYLVLTTLLLIHILALPVKAQTYNNLQIHVSLVITNADGTYTIQEEYPVENRPFVRVTNIGTGRQWKGYVNNVGWIFFTINETGRYRIEIIYTEAQYKPREFNIDDINTITILQEYIFRLAVFFSGDQITIFQKIQISLPGSITFYFPQSQVNATVKSYGLRYNITRTEKQYTLTPWDYCDPIFDPATGLVTLYPNYTLNLKLRTETEGYIGMLVIDNATLKFYSTPLYKVPRGATVDITAIIETKRIQFLQLLQDIYADLDFIKRILLEIRQLINNTLIPRVRDIQKFLEKAFGPYTISDILSRLSSIANEIMGMRDRFSVFIDTLQNSINSLLRNEMAMNERYMYYALIFLCLIVIAVAVYKKESKKVSSTREPAIVIR